MFINYKMIKMMKSNASNRFSFFNSTESIGIGIGRYMIKKIRMKGGVGVIKFKRFG